MDYYCCIELVEVVGLHDLEEKKSVLGLHNLAKVLHISMAIKNNEKKIKLVFTT